jgi:Zn-dependent peptidase ImmA (M78 family)
MVESGEDWLSLDEAEKAADVYDRPLASLFLPEPPDEAPQEVQFRRLPGAPKPPCGPRVQLTARRVIERQQVAVELYEDLEQTPPWASQSARLLTAPRDELPSIARKALDVSREEQQSGWGRDVHAPFRGWRAAVERLGILVMQAGPVEVSEMRGFASIEPTAVPAILVNNKDDPRARAFTVIHELGHVVLAARGESVGPKTERWCESFAGQVLMPGPWLREELNSAISSGPIGRVHDVASAFRVTPLAAAVRISRSGLRPSDDWGAVIGQIQKRWQAKDDDQPTGGDYYRNQVSRFGPGYLRLVFAALDSQALTLPAASAVLDGVKVKNFERLRNELERR